MLKKFVTIFLITLIPNLGFAKDLSNSIVRKLQAQIDLIVIDPGFGGNQTGPSGCDGVVFAKDINLQISKKLAEGIKNSLNINALLTRESDAALSLEARATFANVNEADLLISIHTNGSDNSSVFWYRNVFVEFSS